MFCNAFGMYPVLAEYAGVVVHTYGVMLSLGFLCSILLLQHEVARAGIDSRKVLAALAVSAISGLAGAKILYVLVSTLEGGTVLNWGLWLGSGMVFYGVPLVAFPVFFFLTRRRKLPSWTLLDLLCLCFLPAHAIGRLGCFFAGCCHGRPTDGPLGVLFSSPFADPTALFRPVHPTQLYEALGVSILFLVLLFMYRRKSSPGLIIIWYLIGYGILRFVLELFRGDPGRGEFAALSSSQWISVFFVGAGISLQLSSTYRNRVRPQ